MTPPFLFPRGRSLLRERRLCFEQNQNANQLETSQLSSSQETAKSNVDTMNSFLEQAAKIAQYVPVIGPLVTFASQFRKQEGTIQTTPQAQRKAQGNVPEPQVKNQIDAKEQGSAKQTQGNEKSAADVKDAAGKIQTDITAQINEAQQKIQGYIKQIEGNSDLYPAINAAVQIFATLIFTGRSILQGMGLLRADTPSTPPVTPNVPGATPPGTPNTPTPTPNTPPASPNAPTPPSIDLLRTDRETPLNLTQNPSASAARLEQTISGERTQSASLVKQYEALQKELGTLFQRTETNLPSTEAKRERRQLIYKELDTLDDQITKIDTALLPKQERIKALQGEQKRRGDLVTQHMSQPPNILAALDGARIDVTYANGVRPESLPGIQLLIKMVDAMPEPMRTNPDRSLYHITNEGNLLQMRNVPALFFTAEITTSIGGLLRQMTQTEQNAAAAKKKGEADPAVKKLMEDKMAAAKKLESDAAVKQLMNDKMAAAKKIEADAAAQKKAGEQPATKVDQDAAVKKTIAEKIAAAKKLENDAAVKKFINNKIAAVPNFVDRDRRLSDVNAVPRDAQSSAKITSSTARAAETISRAAQLAATTKTVVANNATPPSVPSAVNDAGSEKNRIEGIDGQISLVSTALRSINGTLYGPQGVSLENQSSLIGTAIRALEIQRATLVAIQRPTSEQQKRITEIQTQITTRITELEQQIVTIEQQIKARDSASTKAEVAVKSGPTEVSPQVKQDVSNKALAGAAKSKVDAFAQNKAEIAAKSGPTEVGPQVKQDISNKILAGAARNKIDVAMERPQSQVKTLGQLGDRAPDVAFNRPNELRRGVIAGDVKGQVDKTSIDVKLQRETAINKHLAALDANENRSEKLRQAFEKIGNPTAGNVVEYRNAIEAYRSSLRAEQDVINTNRSLWQAEPYNEANLRTQIRIKDISNWLNNIDIDLKTYRNLLG